MFTSTLSCTMDISCWDTYRTIHLSYWFLSGSREHFHQSFFFGGAVGCLKSIRMLHIDILNSFWWSHLPLFFPETKTETMIIGDQRFFSTSSILNIGTFNVSHRQLARPFCLVCKCTCPTFLRACPMRSTMLCENKGCCALAVFCPVPESTL